MKTSNIKDYKTVSSLEQIVEFQKILKVLQKYAKLSNPPFSPSFYNREELVDADPKNVHLEISQQDQYTYHVKSYDRSIREFEHDSCTWVHLDGIKEERDSFLQKNIENHPVFSITCLTDIYSKI